MNDNNTPERRNAGAYNVRDFGLDYSNTETITVLKNTIAKNATNEEFAIFLQFCKSTGLNPFKKEIWFIKTNGGVQIMTGINGFWSLANNHPQFDGAEEDIECDEKGNPVKAICKIYRKDRRFPSVGIALLKEYRKNTPIWGQMTSVMLAKCAASNAIRKAFPQELNGLYTEEEMPEQFSARAVITNEQPTQPAAQPVVTVTADNAPTQVMERPETMPIGCYSIPDISRVQELFLEKRGAEWNEFFQVWVLRDITIDVARKLAQYKVETPAGVE